MATIPRAALRRLLPAALIALPLAAAAQGFPGAGVGLPSTYVPRSATPPNPFASNLPSGPPPVVEGRRRVRARRPPRDPEALLPPGRVPR